MPGSAAADDDRLAAIEAKLEGLDDLKRKLDWIVDFLKSSPTSDGRPRTPPSKASRSRSRSPPRPIETKDTSSTGAARQSEDTCDTPSTTSLNSSTHGSAVRLLGGSRLFPSLDSDPPPEELPFEKSGTPPPLQAFDKSGMSLAEALGGAPVERSAFSSFDGTRPGQLLKLPNQVSEETKFELPSQTTHGFRGAGEGAADLASGKGALVKALVHGGRGGSGERDGGVYYDDDDEDEELWFEPSVSAHSVRYSTSSLAKQPKSGGTMVETELAEQEASDKGTTVKNDSDAGMINPRNHFRLGWDLGVVMPLLVYLTIVMPFRLSFVNEAPPFTPIYWFEFIIDMIFLFDIGFNFRTGVYVLAEGGGAEEAELVEYDRWRVATAYFKSWFILDVISGIPFALLEILLDSDGGGLGGLKAAKILRFLKLGRLLKMNKILTNLDRDTQDRIADFLQDGSTRSAVVMMKLIFYMAFANHLFACGFVVVGKAGSRLGKPNWLEEEMDGPFDSADTTGIHGDRAVYSIYVAAFYFCLTTMTSVGYGDIITHNNTERMYVIILQLASAIIFATIIAMITSVVTSSDMNARKVSEQLDAVSSFVNLRKFPIHMARRINRHFRHFYSVKSAIDETKIFTELSTSLRKEVSEYLVVELMGPVSFFMSLPPTLWPRLLPLLRPMTFEKKEVVCRQGEECVEMYVVLEGMLTATTYTDPQKAGINSAILSRPPSATPPPLTLPPDAQSPPPTTFSAQRATRATGWGGTPGGSGDAGQSSSSNSRGGSVGSAGGGGSKLKVRLGGQSGAPVTPGPEGHPSGMVPKVVRQITTGNSVNALHVLGVWHRCVETVVACQNQLVETYAVTAEDFDGLFNLVNDKEAFAKMQKNEVQNYAMDRSEPAPTELGRPLHYSCFSSLEVEVCALRAPVQIAGKLVPGSFLILDLVDKTTGSPFNDGWWRHATKRLHAPNKQAKKDNASPKMVKSSEFVVHRFMRPPETFFRENASPTAAGRSSPGGKRSPPPTPKRRTSFSLKSAAASSPEVFRWSDIWAPFSKCALRVRLYAPSKVPGKDMLVARALIPLVNLEDRRNGGGAQFCGEEATFGASFGGGGDASGARWVDLVPPERKKRAGSRLSSVTGAFGGGLSSFRRPSLGGAFNQDLSGGSFDAGGGPEMAIQLIAHVGRPMKKRGRRYSAAESSRTAAVLGWAQGGQGGPRI